MSIPYIVRPSGLLPVNGGTLVPWPTAPGPDPDPPYDAELGIPGDRPALTERPGPTNTGPRQPTTQTMSGSQAIAAAQSAPVEEDGYRYLRRARITGTLTFNNAATQSGLAFEDCYITSGATYVVTTMNFGIPARKVKFQFCEIEGGSSSTIYGGQAMYLRCNLHRGVDIIKPERTGLEVYGCWAHDTWHPSGAHCDVVQILTRAGGTLIHWNFLHGRNAPDSPSSAGGYSSGVLQTGTVTGPIGPVQWLDNWLDGAGYTIRTGNSTNRQGHSVEYLFRRNRFGRDYNYGPFLGTMDGVDWDDSNVWDDTGLPVL